MSEMCNDAKTKCQFYTCVLKILLVTADGGSLINLTSVIQYVLKLSDLHLSQNKILQNLMVSDHLRLPRVLVFRSNCSNKRL